MPLFLRSVADKIMQRDADCILLNNTLSQAEQDEDDPYADFKSARRFNVVILKGWLDIKTAKVDKYPSVAH